MIVRWGLAELPGVLGETSVSRPLLAQAIVELPAAKAMSKSTHGLCQEHTNFC